MNSNRDVLFFSIHKGYFYQYLFELLMLIEITVRWFELGFNAILHILLFVSHAIKTNNFKKSGLSGCFVSFLFFLSRLCFNNLFLFFPVVFFQFYVFSLFQCFMFLFVTLCFVFTSYFFSHCHGKEWFEYYNTYGQ